MTNSDLQNKFRAFLLQTKRYSEERTDSTIQFAESDLVEFISKYFDPEFSSIYSSTDDYTKKPWSGLLQTMAFSCRTAFR